MTPRLALAAVIIAVSAADVYLLRHDGYWSVFPPFATGHAAQMFLDLSVSLTLVMIWMVQDWRKRGGTLLGVAPFLIGTFFLGSIAPLAYLLIRLDKRAERA